MQSELPVVQFNPIHSILWHCLKVHCLAIYSADQLDGSHADDANLPILSLEALHVMILYAIAVLKLDMF